MAAESEKSRAKRARRFAVTAKAEVVEGSRTLGAIIQDISENGVLFVCCKEFTPGQIFGLRLQLSNCTFVECEIEVRHSNDMGTGARIVSMDDQSRSAYARQLDEFYLLRTGLVK